MQRSLLAILFVPCLWALGCNSLTEPNEFRVQKEKPRTEAPKAAEGDQKPGSVVMMDAPKGQPAPNAPANVEKMPVKAQAPAAPHAHAPGGSCGE